MSSTPKHPIFNENCPRPPVPGEETDAGLPASGYPPGYPPLWNLHRKNDSPVLTPRRSSLAPGSQYTTTTLADTGAPLGFEPEGSCGSGDTRGRYPHEQPSPPPYMRWAQNLDYLLEDSEGVELFLTFLKQEGQSDTLEFWFACEGLKKQTDQAKFSQIVKVIYKKYILRSQFAIPDDLRKEVNRQVKGGDFSHSGIFDAVQSAVEQLISQTTYPNFLKSDLYLQHVQSMQNGSSDNGESGSSSSSSRDPPRLGSGCPLPTLHEDTEFSESLPLTKRTLMETERRRAMELKPKPEAYAGMFLQRSYRSPFLTHLNNPHVLYNSYNPVSRQDSELQSLSSDARTESDNLSLTDGFIDEMSSVGRRSSRHQHMRQSRQIKENANINRDPHSHRNIIPRTQNPPKETLSPKEFAALLVKKLENVKKELETQEKLDRKLLENDGSREDMARSEPVVAASASSSRALADALREKLQVEDDNDQDILDQHVSRVWSDQTPSRSPGFSSPRPKSPDITRRRVPVLAQESALPATAKATGVLLHPYQSRTSSRHTRKEKDGFSTFSSDSGTVHDFIDISEHKHHAHVPKSRSVPDYGELRQEAYSDRDRHRDRDRDRDRDRERQGTCRRPTMSSSRKTPTNDPDSGVSVVSDRQPQPLPSLGHGVPSGPGVPSLMKDKVLNWLIDSDRQQSASTGSRSETSSKQRARDRVTSTSGACAASATSPITSRLGRKSGVASTSGNVHSRSDSPERSLGVTSLPSGSIQGVPVGAMPPSLGVGLGAMAVEPAQPFVADPSMPPLPHPHTATQLEEARRRLLDDTYRQRPRYNVGSKLESSHCNSSHSTPSTLKRAIRPAHTRSDQAPEQTTVVLSFCDEQFPYRIRIPHRPVTLGLFKEYLPRKGNYRYFFKTECEELDMKAIQEEVQDDNEIVPLWEGKIMALVKQVE